ncbi:hypothetical protein O7A70_31480 [Mesorhizobium sp. Cs1299R1N1]
MTKKALPFVPTKIHISTVEDEKGALFLSIQTTKGSWNRPGPSGA